MVLICFDCFDGVLSPQTKPLSEASHPTLDGKSFRWNKDLSLLWDWDGLLNNQQPLDHLQDMDSADMMGPQQGMNPGSTAKKWQICW